MSFRTGGVSSANSVGNTSGGDSQEGALSSPEDASEPFLIRRNRSSKLETMMYKERQTMENLVQSMRALTLARKQENEVGESMIKEVRRRLWLYGFLLKSQQAELHKCLLDECNKYGYSKEELNEAMRKGSNRT